MQERYQCEIGDDMAEYAMYCKLRDAGIDFKAMFEEHNEEHRFCVGFTK